tara:strand:+ start:2773 stop:4026 length:1254 start_codon:yes stop_codon:yes gene_type:complete
MAFNFMAALGGAATAFSEFADEKVERAEKIADREYLTEQEERRFQRGLDAEKNKRIESLASELSVYFDPANTEDILKGGTGNAQFMINVGKEYRAARKDANAYYNLKKSVSTTSPVIKMGEVSSGVSKLTSEIPEGLGTDASTSTLTPSQKFPKLMPTKIFNTYASFELDLLQERINTDPNNTDAMKELDRKETALIEQLARLAEAERERTGDKNNYYDVSQIRIAKEGRIKQAREKLNLELGTTDQIMNDLEGSNIGIIANIMAAKELKITNDLVGKDENMYNEITSMAQIAATDLQNFAQYKVPKLPMAFESKEQLKEAVLNGIITTGDIYAVKIDVPVPRTSVPAFIGGTYLGKEYQDVMGINPTTGKNYVIDGFLNMPYAFDPSKTFPTYTSENISQAEGTIPKPKRQSTGDT